MSKSISKNQPFTLVGQLLAFVIKEGNKVKYLRINIAEQEYWIKVPKPLGSDLDLSLKPGDYLEISGYSKPDSKKGILKLKAEEIKLIDSIKETEPLTGSTQSNNIKKRKKKASILVCQKSTCWRRGGKDICEAVEGHLRDRGLEEEVEVKRTGCLKQCKKGPNVVMMPEKGRYSQVKPQQVINLLEKQLP